MPINLYKCKQCFHEDRKFVKESHLTIFCSECGSSMQKVWRNCPDTKITEKKDKFKNKNIVSGLDEVTRKRSKDYFVDNCIDEAIDKVAENFGEKEAIAHAKRAGWIDSHTGKKTTKLGTK